MTRSFPDLTDSLEWNLVARRALEGTASGRGWRIPNQQLLIDHNSYCVAVGLKNPKARANWLLGGWATHNVLITTSSTSEFTTFTQVSKRRLSLNRLNLFVVEKIQTPWILDIGFPPWHEQITLEVWRYDGRDQDDLAALITLQQSVDRLSPSPPPAS